MELIRRNDPVGKFNLYTYLEHLPYGDEEGKQRLLKEAADQGLAEAQNDYSLTYWWDKPLDYLTKAAEQGLREAYANLGQYYAVVDVNRDYPLATYWWKKAAQESYIGVPTYNLALAYENGTGIGQNITEAIYWYQRTLGNDVMYEAYNALAILYEMGKGVSQDIERAHKLYERGAELGDDAAMKNLETIGQGASRLKEDDFMDDPLDCGTFILTSGSYGNLGNFFP